MPASICVVLQKAVKDEGAASRCSGAARCVLEPVNHRVFLVCFCPRRGLNGSFCVSADVVTLWFSIPGPCCAAGEERLRPGQGQERLRGEPRAAGSSLKGWEVQGRLLSTPREAAAGQS